MSRYKEGHPRYRTFNKIVEDIAYVLNAPLTHGTKYAVLNNACSEWTKINGEYRHCTRWTKAAMAECRLAVQRGLKRKCADLDHEHAVPKSEVIKLLLALELPTPVMVREICERFLIGVVVTKGEHTELNKKYRQKMPKEFFDSSSSEYHDPFLRYKRCNIVIEDVVPAHEWWQQPDIE